MSMRRREGAGVVVWSVEEDEVAGEGRLDRDLGVPRRGFPPTRMMLGPCRSIGAQDALERLPIRLHLRLVEPRVYSTGSPLMILTSGRLSSLSAP